MKKDNRRQLIRQILLKYPIERQEEFVSRLKDEGINVTQATISRDIKEMNLVKLPAAEGGYRYSLPVDRVMDIEKSFVHTLRSAFVNVQQKEFFVVLKVHPGNGQAVSSLIDQMDFKRVLGTVGDDDTVFLMMKDQDAAVKMSEYLIHAVGAS